jgi:hypothetical protein
MALRGCAGEGRLVLSPHILHGGLRHGLGFWEAHDLTIAGNLRELLLQVSAPMNG